MGKALDNVCFVGKDRLYLKNVHFETPTMDTNRGLKWIHGTEEHFLAGTVADRCYLKV